MYGSIGRVVIAVPLAVYSGYSAENLYAAY